MKFEKGREKTGGREAGTPNKAAKELRNQLQAIVQTSLNELPDTLAGMEPTRRARLLTALLPYVMPKLNSVELRAELKGDEPKKDLPPWLGVAATKKESTFHPENERHNGI
jgi:vacuolar-type H+-ATPase subunit E/Vma4